MKKYFFYDFEYFWKAMEMQKVQWTKNTNSNLKCTRYWEKRTENKIFLNQRKARYFCTELILLQLIIKYKVFCFTLHIAFEFYVFEK